MARRIFNRHDLYPLRRCETSPGPGGRQLRLRRTGHGWLHLALWALLLLIVVGGLTVPVVLGILRGRASVGEMSIAGALMLPYAALFALAMLRHPTALRPPLVTLPNDRSSPLEVGTLCFTRDELVGPMLFPYYYLGNINYSLELLFRERPPLRLALDRSTRPLAEAAEAIADWLGGPAAAVAVDPVLAAELPVAPQRVLAQAAPPPDDVADLGSQPLLEFYELRSVAGRGRLQRTQGCLVLTSKGPLAPVFLTLLVLMLLLAVPAISFLMSGRANFPCIVLPIAAAVSLSTRLWVFLRDFELRVYPNGYARLTTRSLGLDALVKVRELGKVVFHVTTLNENKGLALLAHNALGKPVEVWRSTTSSDLQRLCLSLQALLGHKIEGSRAVQAAALPAGPIFYQDRVSEIRFASTSAADGEPPDISLRCRLRWRPLLLDGLGLQLLASPLYALGLVPLTMNRSVLGGAALAALLIIFAGIWLARWLPAARPWPLRIDADGPRLTRGEQVGSLLDVDMQLAVEPLTLWPRFKKGSRLVLRSAGRRYLLAAAAHAGFLSALEHSLRVRLEGAAEDWLPSGPAEAAPEDGSGPAQAGPGEV